MLEMEEGNVVFSALIVYLFPLVSMIAGYFISLRIGEVFKFNTGESIGIVGSVFFLAISFYIINKINNHLRSNKKFQPKIIKILE